MYIFLHCTVRFFNAVKLSQLAESVEGICPFFNTVCELDVRGSVHHNINLIERTNKMQPCSRIYYSNVP